MTKKIYSVWRCGRLETRRTIEADTPRDALLGVLPDPQIRSATEIPNHAPFADSIRYVVTCDDRTTQEWRVKKITESCPSVLHEIQGANVCG